MARLDQEEQDLLDSFERGEWQSIEGGREAFERYRDYARTTFKKDRRVNIRISSKDLEALQKRASRRVSRIRHCWRAFCTNMRPAASLRRTPNTRCTGR